MANDSRLRPSMWQDVWISRTHSKPVALETACTACLLCNPTRGKKAHLIMAVVRRRVEHGLEILRRQILHDVIERAVVNEILH